MGELRVSSFESRVSNLGSQISINMGVIYEPRWYRRLMEGERFVSFTVSHLETDLWIGIDSGSFNEDIHDFILQKAIEIRSVLDKYIAKYPDFLTSLVPLKADQEALPVINEMINASAAAGTGPMSAVAGLFAQVIGQAVIEKFGVKEIIVENGGDLFLSVQKDLEVAVYAGHSPLSNKVAVVVPAEYSPLGLCTSSGTVGHSLSFGKTDAAMIACRNAVLADAFATRFGNEVKAPSDIPAAIELSSKFPEILSIIIIAQDQIGIRGKFKVRPM